MKKTEIDILVKRILSEDLDESSDQLEKDEIMHLLLDKKLTKNSNVTRNNSNLAEKISDGVARIAGSWNFILCFVLFLVLWIIVNVLMMRQPFDPYPFILLNLLLSCIAALQAPIIMMSQTRQEMKDRARAENDYKVNLKSEIIIEDIHHKLETLIDNQAMIIAKISEIEKSKI